MIFEHFKKQSYLFLQIKAIYSCDGKAEFSAVNIPVFSEVPSEIIIIC